MKYFRYAAIRDGMSTEKSYWQVWVYDSRAVGGLRLVEPCHHTKQRAHALAKLLNHEMREFMELNKGDEPREARDVAEPRPTPPAPVLAVKCPSLWGRVLRFVSGLFKEGNSK
jgi:hypothetical protein